MKISNVQEKLQKAKLIGADQVALHEGKLEVGRFYGIKGIKLQNNTKAFIIFGEEKAYGTSIDELISRLEEVKERNGDLEVKGSFEFEPLSLKETQDIKTICVIAYKIQENEDKLIALLSVSDLT